MLVTAYAVIVLLTWYLVGMNVRTAIKQHEKDKNEVRLYSYLMTLLVVGSLIIAVTSSIVQRVIDAEEFLQSDKATPVGIRYYHR